MNSAVTAGESSSWIWMSWKSSIPGSRCWVVNGYSATSGLARVRALSREDLPPLGGPTSTTWAAPSRSKSRPPPLPAFLPPASCSSLSLARRRFRSANRWSVPLCLGRRAIKSCRRETFSSRVRAARKASSAFRYSGVTLVGMQGQL